MSVWMTVKGDLFVSLAAFSVVVPDGGRVFVWGEVVFPVVRVSVSRSQPP